MSKTAKLFWAIALAAGFLLAVNVKAQTITNSTPVLSGPVKTIIDFLGSGTNWMIAPYGIYDTGSKKAGGGIGAFKNLNTEFMALGLRVDYVDSQIWMPSVNLQLQAPIKLFNKVTFTPFGSSGIATPLSGKGKDNGDPVGLFGMGLAAKLADHWMVAYDFEKWTSPFTGNQHRLAVVYKF